MGYDFNNELEAQAKEFGIWLDRMVEQEQEQPTPKGNFMLEGELRWLRPIGPAPKGWETIPTCHNTIPHNDEAEWWMNDDMNDDMNKDHYAVE